MITPEIKARITDFLVIIVMALVATGITLLVMHYR